QSFVSKRVLIRHTAFREWASRILAMGAGWGPFPECATTPTPTTSQYQGRRPVLCKPADGVCRVHSGNGPAGFWQWELGGAHSRNAAPALLLAQLCHRRFVKWVLACLQ